MNFVLMNDAINNYQNEGGLYVVVDRKFSSKVGLFSYFASELDAPNGYFGLNWDAFVDCLCDLTWVSHKHISLVHGTLPFNSDSENAKYIDAIQTAAHSHQAYSSGGETFSGVPKMDLRLLFDQSLSGELDRAQQ